jgi:hypothetical protein
MIMFEIMVATGCVFLTILFVCLSAIIIVGTIGIIKNIMGKVL